MKLKVDVSEQAQADLAEIHGFIAQQDGTGRADQALDELEAAILSLEAFANRGLEPPELSGMGKGFLQIHHKPWRILYKISGSLAVVVLVADGRRNFDALLTRRILRGR
jgi:toxin ParE1/3/4